MSWTMRQVLSNLQGKKGTVQVIKYETYDYKGITCKLTNNFNGIIAL